MSLAPFLLGALLLWAGEAMPAGPAAAPLPPSTPPVAVPAPLAPPPPFAAVHPRSEAPRPPRPPRHASAVVVHPHAAPAAPRPPSPSGRPHAAPRAPQPPAVVLAHPPPRAARAAWVMAAGGFGPRLGTRVTDMTPQLRSFFGAPKDAGLLVQGVEPGSAAEGAAVKVGDVIVAVDGQPIGRTRDVQRVLADHQAGDEVEVEVVRNKKRKTLRATLADDGSSTIVMPPGPRFDHDVEIPPEAMQALPPEVRQEVRRQLEHARQQLHEVERTLEALEGEALTAKPDKGKRKVKAGKKARARRKSKKKKKTKAAD